MEKTLRRSSQIGICLCTESSDADHEFSLLNSALTNEQYTVYFKEVVTCQDFGGI